MKHLHSITKTPSQAMSVVEFDGVLGIFGRALAQITSSITLFLTVLGLPDKIEDIKGAE